MTAAHPAEADILKEAVTVPPSGSVWRLEPS
jgi:hypothetical protein